MELSSTQAAACGRKPILAMPKPWPRSPPLRSSAARLVHTQASQPAGTVTLLDRRTLRITRHQVTPHPFCVPTAPRSQPAIPPPLPNEELAERWQRLSDNRFGAFTEPDDTRFRQLPLKVTLARMSDPCGLLRSGVGLMWLL